MHGLLASISTASLGDFSHYSKVQIAFGVLGVVLVAMAILCMVDYYSPENRE